MPALSNPRYEAFAQALFIGLGGKTRQERANSTAYLTAYPGSTAPGSAKASAARLLTRVSPILERVRELQAEDARRVQRKVDISRERIARKLDRASEIAEQQDNPAAMVQAELGIAKVFGHTTEQTQAASTFEQAQSMQDIGRKLLISVGFQEPDDVSINEAIEAKDAFIDRLETIRDRSRRTIDS
jgi:dihydropteroate synthase